MPDPSTTNQGTPANITSHKPPVEALGSLLSQAQQLASFGENPLQMIVRGF